MLHDVVRIDLCHCVSLCVCVCMCVCVCVCVYVCVTVQTPATLTPSEHSNCPISALVEPVLNAMLVCGCAAARRVTGCKARCQPPARQGA